MSDAHDISTPAISAFERLAGVSFNDKELLRTAFTHRSYVNESSRSAEHNERLEFLGDAVIEIVVTDHLFHRYPDASEGVLTSYRAALVNAVTLGSVAERLGMNEYLLLSKGEAKDTGRARATILANAFEAVVGALYLDQGYDVAAHFVQTQVMSRIDDVVKTGAWKDAKSAFQELAQAKHGLTPRYDVVRAEGPDHAKHFIVAVFVGDDEVAQGEGKSKQEAEQDAATRALSEES